MQASATITIQPSEMRVSMPALVGRASEASPGVRWHTRDHGTRVELEGDTDEVIACVQRMRRALRAHGVAAASTRIRRLEPTSEPVGLAAELPSPVDELGSLPSRSPAAVRPSRPRVALAMTP